MSGGGHRSQTGHERHALTYLPKSAGDASPPSPKGQTIKQRWNMGDRMTLACGDQGESERERKYDYVAIPPKFPACSREHGSALNRRQRNPGFCSSTHWHPFKSPCPDFLSNSLALANFMRLSLLKVAHVVVGECRVTGNPGSGEPVYRKPLASMVIEHGQFPARLPRLCSESWDFCREVGTQISRACPLLLSYSDSG
jgi:hypothetical protein